MRSLNTDPSSIIEVKQSFSTIDPWTPINSILFTSSTLPVTASLLSNPHIMINNQVSNTNNSSNFDSVITDIVSNQQCFKPQLLYEPSSEYR